MPTPIAPVLLDAMTQERIRLNGQRKRKRYQAARNRWIKLVERLRIRAEIQRKYKTGYAFGQSGTIDSSIHQSSTQSKKTQSSSKKRRKRIDDEREDVMKGGDEKNDAEARDKNPGSADHGWNDKKDTLLAHGDTMDGRTHSTQSLNQRQQDDTYVSGGQSSHSVKEKERKKNGKMKMSLQTREGGPCKHCFVTVKEQGTSTNDTLKRVCTLCGFEMEVETF